MGTIHPRSANPAAPAAMVRRSDGDLPCHDHPLDRGKSDQAPAGLLAHGSWLDARPSQAPHDLASGPVAASLKSEGSDVYRAHRLQLQGQPRIRIGPANIACPFLTVFHNYALSGTGACMSLRIIDPQRARSLMAIARNANPSSVRFVIRAPKRDDFRPIQQGFHYVWRIGRQSNHVRAFANHGVAGSGKPAVLRPAIAFR